MLRRWFTLSFALSFALGTVPALAAPPVAVTQLLATQTTVSGQPIVLPQHDVELIVTRLVIQPGATLPVHEHPYQRYGYVLSGHLTVTMSDTKREFHYRPGEFIVEARDQWHFGKAVGNEPLVLLVIDQVEAGHDNTIRRPAG